GGAARHARRCGESSTPAPRRHLPVHAGGADRLHPRPPRAAPGPLGRAGARRRHRPRALRAQRRAALHPRVRPEAGGERHRGAPPPRRLPLPHHGAWHGRRARRRAGGRPGALRPRRPHDLRPLLPLARGGVGGAGGLVEGARHPARGGRGGGGRELLRRRLPARRLGSVRHALVVRGARFRPGLQRQFHRLPHPPRRHTGRAPAHHLGAPVVVRDAGEHGGHRRGGDRQHAGLRALARRRRAGLRRVPGGGSGEDRALRGGERRRVRGHRVPRGAGEEGDRGGERRGARGVRPGALPGPRRGRAGRAPVAPAGKGDRAHPDEQPELVRRAAPEGGGAAGGGGGELGRGAARGARVPDGRGGDRLGGRGAARRLGTLRRQSGDAAGAGAAPGLRAPHAAAGGGARRAPRLGRQGFAAGALHRPAGAGAGEDGVHRQRGLARRVPDARGRRRSDLRHHRQRLRPALVADEGGDRRRGARSGRGWRVAKHPPTPAV
ncbi:MAG: D-alanyl-D-alanine carboxypeptidase, partial [uncultured Gemmatimonadetes bacterium]